jgi:hypothetical protein
VTFCHGFKLPAPDGKLRETDCADTEGVFRIIQSIPSQRAEPFKLWLAKVGYERVEEVEDPELAIQKTMRTYLKKGSFQNDPNGLRIKFTWARMHTTPDVGCVCAARIGDGLRLRIVCVLVCVRNPRRATIRAAPPPTMGRFS